jgi:hypothetical protein
MPEFAHWLRARANPDPDTVALRAFADPRSDWPWWTDSLGDYVAIIQSANPANRDALISALSVNYGRWEAERTRSGGILSDFARHLGTLFLALFGVIVAAAIFYGLFINQNFFRLMADVGQARGLITFLFAFSTIAIILLVAITTFWMPKEDVQIRFEKAKDLLTIIIGVLGTILGFYFGSLTVSDRQAAPATNAPAAATSHGEAGAGEATH